MRFGRSRSTTQRLGDFVVRVAFDIVENERIVFAYSMARDGVVFSVSLATVELHAEGNSTRLVFTEQAAFFENSDGPQMRQQGWTTLLNSFGKEVARAA